MSNQSFESVQLPDDSVDQLTWFRVGGVGLRRGKHCDGAVGDLLCDGLDGVVGSRLEPPGDPVAHAQHRQCANARVDWAEMPTGDAGVYYLDDDVERRTSAPEVFLGEVRR